MAPASRVQTVLSVPGITSSHCKRVITTLRPANGVEGTAVDIPTRRVLLDYDPTRVDLGRLTADLANAG